MKGIENKTLVYIIDDNPLFQRVMERKFQTLSPFRVMTFSSGEDFIEYIKQNRLPKSILQIAICDYNFLNKIGKQMNGIEIIKEIRKINPNIKIILTSQDDDKDIINKALSIDKTNISFILKNEQNFELFHDQVRLLVSEHTVKILKRRKIISQIVFFSTLLIGIILALVLKP